MIFSTSYEEGVEQANFAGVCRSDFLRGLEACSEILARLKFSATPQRRAMEIPEPCAGFIN